MFKNKIYFYFEQQQIIPYAPLMFCKTVLRGKLSSGGNIGKKNDQVQLIKHRTLDLFLLSSLRYTGMQRRRSAGADDRGPGRFPCCSAAVQLCAFEAQMRMRSCELCACSEIVESI